ncbi:MAG: hypothetical protein KDD62_06545, partial [Bdellovibrionales bacterium]|nr:hypothetical protein [Bdellovibrionales bacterium]
VATQALYLRTGCPPFFQYPAARLFYFKEKEPHIFERIASIHSSKSFLLYQLTGEFLSDPSTEAASQLMNLHTRTWDPEILATLELDLAQLPKIVEPLSTALPLTPKLHNKLNLTADVRVLPGVYDGGAVGIGLGGFSESTAVINIGTTGMLRVATSQPVVDQNPKMRFQTYYLMDDLYLTGGGINNATLPARWMKEQLFNQGYPEMLGEAVKAPLGSNKLFFLPYLTGERDWSIGNSASGVLFGLREYHSKSDMVRSLLEGVAYCLAMIKAALVENGVAIEQMRIGGGGSKLPLWLEIITNTLNCRLQRTALEESCLLGDAALGQVYLGTYKNVSEAVEQMVTWDTTLEPEPAAASAYRDYFEFYQELYESLAPAYRRHAAFLR